MAIRLVKDRILRTELKVLAGEDQAQTVKAVADVRRGIIGFGGSLHHDIETTLLADGSALKDLWGFSLFTDRPWSEAFEFRSHVNVRPRDGSPSIQLHDEKLCAALRALAAQRVDWEH